MKLPIKPNSPSPDLVKAETSRLNLAKQTRKPQTETKNYKNQQINTRNHRNSHIPKHYDIPK